MTISLAGRKGELGEEDSNLMPFLQTCGRFGYESAGRLWSRKLGRLQHPFVEGLAAKFEATEDPLGSHGPDAP